MSEDQRITKCAIYPAIGISRIGNAPNDNYYLAPEIPGKPAKVTNGYKDREGKVKKQVARFRIYGLTEDGTVVRELTADEAQIEWRVHVANRKAAWYQFNNALDIEGLGIPSAFRNKDIVGEDRTKKLVIDPGSRSISGKNTQGKEYYLSGGKFFDKEVPLGEIRTDEKGRLLFFGGNGDSASYDNKPATTFANNNGWHDDVSDGPVRATVKFGNLEMEAEPAMVAVVPPNFGQGLYGVVTMYDIVIDLFYRKEWLNRPEQPDFWENIYPIFERMTQTQWVNEGFFFLFGYNSPSNLTDPVLLKTLSDPSDISKSERERLFRWFRNPEKDTDKPVDVPPFYGDAFGDYKNIAKDDLSVTSTQYYWLHKWAEGNFISKTKTPDTCQSLEDMSPPLQTEALNKAALEECLGGPFHPGIELTWPMRVASMWKAPFRLNTLPEVEEPKDNFGPLLGSKMALGSGGPLQSSGPGTLTRWLGVPWQTDEASCLSGGDYNPSTYLPLPSFWAARVPNQVLSEDSYQRLSDTTLNPAQRLKHFDYRPNWLRDLGSVYQTKINNMVQKWYELGIIVKKDLSENNNKEQFLPNQVWVETDRGSFSESDPSFEQVKYAEKVAEKVIEQRPLTGPQKTSKRQRPVFGRGEV
ncbi:LodA/GoxA family CTQ-dependent oxidase [Nostoc sp.]|uniref:LodA/GoxA family CTQ-dependent oxidase n=1 Tax=Nostoc sp. TaxID=1180 RepID=UPI002FF6EACE